MTWGYINRILGQPSLIRESSIAKFPGSSIIYQAKNKVKNYSTMAKAEKPLENKNGLGNVVLHPSLKRRIEHLARATSNTKTHQAPFRNMLFYGPPGTGKTMVAREIARKSVMMNFFQNFSSLASILLYFCFCRLHGSCLDLTFQPYSENFGNGQSFLNYFLFHEFCCAGFRLCHDDWRRCCTPGSTSCY